MMPISQLVVLVSYNFWVQLVHSDFPHKTGLKEKEEEKRDSWTVKTVAEEQKMTQEVAQREIMEKLVKDLADMY